MAKLRRKLKRLLFLGHGVVLFCSHLQRCRYFGDIDYQKEQYRCLSMKKQIHSDIT